MKILYMTNYPAPYRVDLFNELGKFCELTVTFEETAEEQDYRDSSWFNQDSSNYNAVFLKRWSISKSKHMEFCYEVFSFLKQDYDFIIVGMYSTITSVLAVSYLKVHHIPYIMQTDGGMIKSGKGIIELIKKSIISKACAWLSTSDMADEYLKFYGAQSEKIYRYPFTPLYNDEILTCPILEKEKRTIKEKLKIPNGKMILAVGRFEHIKGFDLLIRAINEINDPNISLCFVGGVATDEFIKLSSESRFCNIFFAGFKKGDALSEYYKAADLFVLPTRGDSWGLVINEAMAYGLPVITTDKCIAGLELIGKLEPSCIVPSEDVDALKKSIVSIIFDDEKLQKLGRINLNNIQKYTIENEANAYMKVLK